MKKMKITILLAVGLIMLLTACKTGEKIAGSEQDKGNEQVSVSKDKKTTVRILTRYTNPDNIREKYFMDMVEKFREENPEIDLQDISISDENSRNIKFRTSVAAGDSIEVFNFLGYAANAEYVKNGVVSDLSQVMQADPAWTQNYVQSLFSAVDYSDWGMDGVYGIPTTPYGVCAFYNKDIFEELNLKVPETWEEIEAAAPALEKAGYIPVAFGAKDDYKGGHFLTALSMKRYGTDLKDKLTAGQENWNDERTLALISYIQKLYGEGIFGEGNLSYNTEGELEKLKNKEAAVILSGSWNIGTINQFLNHESIVCKGFPYFGDKPEYKDMWMGGPDDFLAMSSKPGDADYEATVKVLKFFTSQEYWQGLYEVQKGAGTYPVVFDHVIEADSITMQFNEYYSNAVDMIGEIEQFDDMTSLMDVVRTELQTLFVGEDAQVIADNIQSEVTGYDTAQ